MPSAATGTSPALVHYGRRDGRWVLVATVLGSAIAFIDATVVNIALPRIGADLDASAAQLQWTVNGYTLSLASLILLGGSLGDRFGRRRMFVVGVTWFAAASLLCGLAPTIEVLIGARITQGIGGALLTPGALAILEASFVPEDRSRAIGAWSGLGGIAGAMGPFLGGWLVQVASWRFVFLINIPLAVVVVTVALRHVPESRNLEAPRRFDLLGALTAVVALAGLSHGFTEWPAQGATSPTVLAALTIGVAGLVAFVLTERRSRHPMLPLEVFRSRAFTAANVVTFVVYGALGGLVFLFPVNLQVVAGFEPLAAGIALMPVTVIMLLLSARAGAVSDRIGPRWPMTVGPLVCACGLVLVARIGPEASYVRDVLPGVLVLGLGLSATVAPLTATALGSVEERHAGVASGVNNAVARAAGLLAVAALPLAGGIGKGNITDARALAPTYRAAMLLCAGLLVVGSLIAFVGIPAGVQARRSGPRPVRRHCAVAGAPLQPRRA